MESMVERIKNLNLNDKLSMDVFGLNDSCHMDRQIYGIIIEILRATTYDDNDKIMNNMKILGVSSGIIIMVAENALTEAE